MTVTGSAAEVRPNAPFELAGAMGTKDLSSGERALLSQQGFAISTNSYRQIFEVYNRSPPPYFITADSVLQAFNVVLEDCLRSQERAFAESVLTNLRTIQAETVCLFSNVAARTNEDADIRQYRESLAYVSALVSVAGRLIETSFPVCPQVRTTVDQELNLVLAADSQAVSPLCSRKVDYTRFKPLGKYAALAASQRYYRCMRFLQEAKFHVESGREILAGLILEQHANLSFWRGGEYPPGIGSFYAGVFGRGDDLDPARLGEALYLVLSTNSPTSCIFDPVADAAKEALKANPWKLSRHVKAVQDRLRQLPMPHICDEILPPEMMADWPRHTKAVRLLCPAYLPDSELLFRNAAIGGRPFPSGLDVGVLLGSKRAVELLRDKESQAVVSQILTNAHAVPRAGSALYPSMLQILDNYRAELERNRSLQAVFQQGAWDDKTLNTLLGGWVEMRHAACLVGKEAVYLLCAESKEYAGYVEPVPQFFIAMADLLQQHQEALCARAKPSAQTRAAEYVDFWDRLLAIGTNNVEDAMDLCRQNRELFRWIPPETLEGRRLWVIQAWMNPCVSAAKRLLAGCPNSRQANKLLVETAINRDDYCFMSELGYDERCDAEIMEYTIQEPDDPYPEYKQLIRLCTQLALIAAKQSHGLPLSDAETQVIKHYGAHLGNICFHAGNSYLHPRDDMPVVAPVFFEPQSGRILQVGVGRAKCLKVLIRDPQTGSNMVCSGGITLYHEFSNVRRVSDEEWRATLLQPGGPMPAPWISRHMPESERPVAAAPPPRRKDTDDSK